jgi:hypothetical protein
MPYVTFCLLKTSQFLKRKKVFAALAQGQLLNGKIK